MPFVIVENDTSQWEDQTGAVYHFPKRYKAWLTPGTEVIYYKGRIKDQAFASARLSAAPHYFGKDEVRLLAARTQDSTKEIQAIIEQLQSQSLSANSGVQETLEILGHNQRLSAEVQDLLGGITEAVNQINGANAQVATAAEEQSCVTADISRNITNIHEIVNQNVAGITQSAAASHELSQLAEQQRRQLAQFQL